MASLLFIFGYTILIFLVGYMCNDCPCRCKRTVSGALKE